MILCAPVDWEAPPLRLDLCCDGSTFFVVCWLFWAIWLWPKSLYSSISGSSILSDLDARRSSLRLSGIVESYWRCICCSEMYGLVNAWSLTWYWNRLIRCDLFSPFCADSSSCSSFWRGAYCQELKAVFVLFLAVWGRYCGWLSWDNARRPVLGLRSWLSSIGFRDKLEIESFWLFGWRCDELLKRFCIGASLCFMKPLLSELFSFSYLTLSAFIFFFLILSIDGGSLFWEALWPDTMLLLFNPSALV